MIFYGKYLKIRYVIISFISVNMINLLVFS
ncbi:hypothetical protein PQC55_gp151 [Escherichia phage vB_EcoP-CHD5UKE1]|uniref:Uncharacterized protein n=1 Tax=Escherichia phage vB_EcoP-CHD5UKE1 TaxID=2865805 RepID=A0ABX9AFK6_9CAUD|nr:hypothetical protein PQC55_gp151 [Escherichia phage vB_EcoP-CHD5UKE1]QZI80607.1 hypothetical protein CHD5UKE1_111 [Escherichia phage vB_EcoP-CHD5UKE1]